MSLRRTLIRAQFQDRRMQAAGRAMVPAYTKTPPVDLTSTTLQRGTGAPGDPFTRVQTNLVSRPPESTVLHQQQGVSLAALSVESFTQQHHMRLTVADWLTPIPTREDNACPLALYVRSHMTPEALPISRSAQAQLRRFETVTLTELSQLKGVDAAMLQQQWRSMVKKMHHISKETLLNRDEFDKQLLQATQELARFVSVDGDAVDAGLVEGVIEILRRDTILDRNKMLQHIADFVMSRALTGGRRIWEKFLEDAERLRDQIMHADESMCVKWDATRELAMPTLKPSVALLFAAVIAARGAPSHLQHDTTTDVVETILKFVPLDDVTNFAHGHIDRIFQAPLLSVFRELKLDDAYRALSCRIAHDSTLRRTRRAELQELASALRDVDEARSLLQLLYNSNNPELKALAVRIGRPTRSGASVSFNGLDAKVWESMWSSAAFELVTNPAVTRRMIDIHAGMVTEDTKRKRRGLFTDTSIKLLKRVVGDEDAANEASRAALAELKLQLLSDAEPRTLLCLLQRHKVDLKPLQEQANARREALRHMNDVPPGLFGLVSTEVALRNPAWLKAGVIRESDHTADPAGAAALALLIRIYLRSAYVPPNAAAHIAQLHRGRIGPLAKGSSETNVEVEVGFAEHYDVFEYKKYDWQGWYQRMVDVHNRNVSLRCKLSNLRVLNANNVPLLDLQTERRLRILAGERVGNGIIKLDTDRFEDVRDNTEFGETKFNELLSEARKAQLGPEYWPSVEVKVRRPSGQTKMRYSLIDWDRVEQQSKAAFEKYAALKKTQLFVPPSSTWLQVSGATHGASKRSANEDGYTQDSLFESLEST